MQIQSKQMSFKIALETETFCSIHPSLLGRQPDLKRLPAQLSKTKDVQTSTQLAGQFSGQNPFRWGLNSSLLLRIPYAAALVTTSWGRIKYQGPSWVYCSGLLATLSGCASFSWNLQITETSRNSAFLYLQFSLPCSFFLPCESKSLPNRPISTWWDMGNSGGQEVKKSFFTPCELLQREPCTLPFSFVGLHWLIGPAPGESPDNLHTQSQGVPTHKWHYHQG